LTVHSSGDPVYHCWMNLTVEKLRYFIVLAEELNFTRAAARVFMTQQAFSEQIRQLEAWLGKPLFDRTTRRVTLTAAGEQLHEPLRAALTLIDEALDQVRALRETGRLVIGCPASGAEELVFVTLQMLRLQRPDLVVELRETQYEDPSCGLSTGLVDVAFVRPPIDSRGLVLRELFSEPIVLAVSSKHPLADADSVSLEDALKEPVVRARKSTPEWDEFWLLCKERGGHPRVGATAGSMMEEIESVASGLASTFWPASAVHLVSRHHGIRFLPIVGGPRTVVALAWRDRPLSPEAQEYVEVVTRVVAADRELIGALEAGRQRD
jgi:DNA-binding transcriptional LysR family regulator